MTEERIPCESLCQTGCDYCDYTGHQKVVWVFLLPNGTPTDDEDQAVSATREVYSPESGTLRFTSVLEPA